MTRFDRPYQEKHFKWSQSSLQISTTWERVDISCDVGKICWASEFIYVLLLMELQAQHANKHIPVSGEERLDSSGKGRVIT